MDIERKRRKQKIRLAITETIMVVAVVITVGVLFAIVTGWRVNRDFSIEQYGQVDIRSYPTGASIIVDGETQAFAFTNTSRMLTEGTHSIKLEKDEFDSWEKDVKVIPGWAVRLRYPRLFRKERKAEIVTEIQEADFVTMAPGRESILYGDNEGRWKWMSVRGDETKISEVDLTKVIEGGIIKRIWAWGSEKMLVLTKNGEWTVVNLSQPKNSVKLGKYDKVAFMDGSGSRVWGLKDNILYTIEVGSNAGARKSLEGVVDFVADDKEVVYLSDKNKIMLYHEGDEGSVEMEIEISEGEKVEMMATEYAGERFVGVVVGEKWTIARMEHYPSYGESMETKSILEKTLDSSTDGRPVVSRNGEFFVMREDGKLVVFDAELAEFSVFEYPEEEVWWLDDYMLTNVEDGMLIVRDFDGTNRRELVGSGVSDYPAMVTANNKWLYYISDGKIIREQVN